MTTLLNYFTGNTKKATEGAIADFNYTGVIPASLNDTFKKLTDAVNSKKNLLTEYSKLPALLKDLENLINNYITKQSNFDKDLESEKQKVENLKNQQQATADQTLKDKLQTEIDSHKATIRDLQQQQQITTNTDLSAINAFSDALIKYINDMPPNTPIDKNLLDRLKAKLSQVNQTKQTDYGNIYDDNDRGNDIAGSDDDINKSVTRLSEGGYRYSSSQMRRKSTARRSSASGSSSSKRRRNKKRTAKKMMLGGKRMKKAKSIKRKNHKKC